MDSEKAEQPISNKYFHPNTVTTNKHSKVCREMELGSFCIKDYTDVFHTPSDSMFSTEFKSSSESEECDGVPHSSKMSHRCIENFHEEIHERPRKELHKLGCLWLDDRYNLYRNAFCFCKKDIEIPEHKSGQNEIVSKSVNLESSTVRPPHETTSNSVKQKICSSEKSNEANLSLKGDREIEIPGDKSGAGNTVSKSFNLESSTIQPLDDITTDLDIQKNYSSEKCNEGIRPMKEWGNEIEFPGDTSSLDDTELLSFIQSSFMYSLNITTTSGIQTIYSSEKSNEANLPLKVDKSDPDDTVSMNFSPELSTVQPLDYITTTSDIQTIYSSEKSNELNLPLKGDKSDPDDTVSMNLNPESSSKQLSDDTTNSPDRQKIYSSEESIEANLPLKEQHEKKILASSVFSPELCNVCINLPFMYTSSISKGKTIKFIEEIKEKNLSLGGESTKLKNNSASNLTKTKHDCNQCNDAPTKSNIQTEKISEEAEYGEVMRVQNLFRSCKIYSSDSDLFQEEKSSKGNNFMAVEGYYKCSGQKSYSPEEKVLIGCEVAKKQNDYLKESAHGNRSIGNETQESEEDQKAKHEKLKFLQNLSLSYKSYSSDSNPPQGEKSPKGINFKSEKECSKYSGPTSDLPEAKALIKGDDPKIKKEYLKESAHGHYPTETVIYLESEKETEIREDFQGTHGDKKENFIKSENSEVKTDYFSDETSEYDDLDDESLVNILCSVFEYICEKDETASSRIEKQNLISEQMHESRDIQSEPYCVKSVLILLYFLDQLEKELQAKKAVADYLKCESEAYVKELNLLDLDNIKNGEEMKKNAANHLSRCKEVYTGMEKDIKECELHSKNLKDLLHIFQEKCCFINKPDEATA